MLRCYTEFTLQAYFKKTVHYEYFQERGTHLQHCLFGTVKVLGTRFFGFVFCFLGYFF